MPMPSAVDRRRRPVPRPGTTAVVVASLLAGLFSGDARASDPKSPEVKAAIAKGVAYLGKSLKNGSGDGSHVLGALAMVKGGADKSHPAVVSALAAIDRRTKGGNYTPIPMETHALYVAGLELMLLEVAGDPATNPQKMQPILNYILAQRQPYGAWYYPDRAAIRPDRYFGDTSITQYSLLGLWTAERAGLDLDKRVWNEAAQWHMTTRRAGGQFAYQPKRDRTGEVIRDTMTAAGACNVLLCARYLHGAEALDANLAEAAAKAEAAAQAAQDAKNARLRKYAVLDRPVDSVDAAEQERQRQALGGAAVSLTKLTETAEDSIDTLGEVMQFQRGQHRLYYLYTLERLGALSGRSIFGERDWYEEGSDHLLDTQQAAGAWTGEISPEVSTSFAVMFLSLSTAKALGKELRRYGGGLLKGGRGLPDDFTKARFEGDEIKYDRPTGDLADLLTQLENTGGADVPAAREAVLETVRVGDREALIAQTARLRRLVDDPRPEVRSVVAWALARGGGPEDVADIFDMLAEDPDAGVVREAHNALAVLSRLPRGPGIPLAMSTEREAALSRIAQRDLPATYTTNNRLRVLPGGPFDGVPPGLSEKERVQAFEDWRSVATAAWDAWRDAVRPYEQRDLTPAPQRP